jgi:integrase/recombinase XerD
LVEKACRERPTFGVLSVKLRRQYELAGKGESTVVNYSRCLSQMALHFGCCPSELDKEQVLDYLHHLKNLHKTPSESYNRKDKRKSL